MSKYARIKPHLDTGLHMGNVRLIPTRRNEVFRRLKSSELFTLLQTQYGSNENIMNLPAINEDKQMYDFNTNSVSTSNTTENNTSAESQQSAHKSTHLGGKSGVSPTHLESPSLSDEHGIFYQTKVVTHDQDEQVMDPCYLLLDIRPKKEFDDYHIATAHWYDVNQLRRDKLGHEIYAYKNKKDRIIAICCNEEAHAIKFATELVQKYIDNVFILATSVKRFCAKYTEYCNGPSPPTPPDPNEPRTIRYGGRRHGSSRHRKGKRKSIRKNSDGESVYSVRSYHSTASTRTWVP